MDCEVLLGVAHADKGFKALSLMASNLTKNLMFGKISKSTDMHTECWTVFRTCRSIRKLGGYGYWSYCTI